VQLPLAQLLAEGRARRPDGTLAHPGSVPVCDGGFWGTEYERQMALISIDLATPQRHKLGSRPAAEIGKARIRLAIESVFSNLRRQLRLRDHLARTIAGLAQRIDQRLLTPTIGILVNVLAGRPPREIVAYDGRQTRISPVAACTTSENSARRTRPRSPPSSAAACTLAVTSA
jgi:hypothetical protein